MVRRTFAAVYDDVARVAALLRREGLKPRARLGVLCANRYEFIVLDLACICLGLHFMPLPVDVNKGRVDEAIAALQLELCFVDDALGRASGPLVRSLRLLADAFGAAGEPEPIVGGRTFESDEPFTTVFTSGSTGAPKPMEVRFACPADFIETCLARFVPRPDDCIAVFLPLTQFSSRLYVYGAVMAGFDVLLSTPARIFFDLKLAQPTILQGIPYFFEGIHDSMIGAVRGSTQARWAYRALRGASRAVPGGLFSLAARRAFARVHEFWGGRMRLLVTGAAPIRPEVIEFFNVVGIPMYEAYGLVETGLITLNHPGASRIGSVGRVLPGRQIAFDAEQQITVQSSLLWGQGYAGDAAGAGRDVFVGPDRIATGDVGYLDRDGYLYLRGRRDDVVVLASGHKVHPSLVERELGSSETIKHAAVFGSGRPYLVCVAAPAAPTVATDDLRRDLAETNRRLPANQQVKGLVRARAPFSLENHLLTPSLKLDRRAIYETYRAEIEALYT
jgi:long-chain acyl-CoA synthetase